MGKQCFLFGQRDAPEQIRLRLTQELRRHIRELGVTEFVIGSSGGFDEMAASALGQMKTEYPLIRNRLALAYHPSMRPVRLPEGFNELFYPREQELASLRVAVGHLNLLMLREADYLIAYVTDDNRLIKAFEHAKALEKDGRLRVTNLAEQGIVDEDENDPDS